jgi:tetratricopeptide (TPR) repeat protein
MMTERKRATRVLWLLIAVSSLIIIGLLSYSVFEGVRQYVALQNPVATSAPGELTTRALVQQEGGDLTGAEASLVEAVLQQETPDRIKQLALVRYRLKKYELAIQSYERLVALQVDVAFAQNGIGNSYRDWAEQRQDRREFFISEAIASYERSVAADAGYVAAYSNLAILLAGENRNEEAQSWLTKGISATNSTVLLRLRENL